MLTGHVKKKYSHAQIGHWMSAVNCTGVSD